MRGPQALAEQLDPEPAHDGPHLVASIRDLGSTNGTFVNSERISSQRLSDGDRITVGRTSVVYRAGRR